MANNRYSKRIEKDYEVVDCNKKIANFMNVSWVHHPVGIKVYPKDKGQNFPYDGEFAKYNTSWDWLMPVVEKIEGLGWQVIIQKHHCEMIHDSYPKIDYGFANKSNTGMRHRLQLCYETVIDFINHYNKCGGNFFIKTETESLIENGQQA